MHHIEPCTLHRGLGWHFLGGQAVARLMVLLVRSVLSRRLQRHRGCVARRSKVSFVVFFSSGIHTGRDIIKAQWVHSASSTPQ